MRLSMFERGKHAVAIAGVALALGVAFAGSAARAQEATPAANATPATITVNGTGTVSVAPDSASVVLGVNIVKPTLAEAQSEATTQMNAVLAVLKDAGIDEKDIQTSNYSVSILQNYDSTGTPGEVTGFQVSNQVNVIVRDLPKLGDILDAVVGAGANSIWGINFMLSDSADAAAQARTAAVADAKDRAEQLAAAVGGSLGRVLSISENYAPISSPIGYGMGGADSAKAVPIQGGSTAVQVMVTITYELNA